MKIIIWISGAAAVVGAALAALIANAAVGDVVYAKRLDPVELSTPQKVKLGALVVDLFPAVAPADAVEFGCVRRYKSAGHQADVSCGGAIEETISDSDFADRVINSRVLDVVSRAGGNVTLRKEGSTPPIDTDAKALATAFITDVWPGVDIATVTYFHCINDQVVTCQAGFVTSAAPADFSADYEAGLVIKALGRVGNRMNGGGEILELAKTLQALGLGGVGLVFFAGVGFAYYKFKTGDKERSPRMVQCPNTGVNREMLQLIGRINDGMDKTAATLDRINERQHGMALAVEETKEHVAILRDRSDTRR